MSITTINGVPNAGTDGYVPVYDPDEKFRIWALFEIYTGGPGENRYVPKLHDLVVDLTTFQWYRVDKLDQTTLIPTLHEIKGVLPNQAISPDDLLLGVGPGTISDTYRIYIDKSVMPYTMSVDKRLRFFGTTATSVKIWRGSDLSGNAKVISGLYSPSGDLLGQTVPLEIAAVANTTNRAVKCIPTCYTTEDLPDGEIVTVVAYADDGHVVSKCQLLVENTAFIPTADSSVNYITGIALESPFLSSADPTLIQYPLNVPLSGLSLIGVVNYSDGSSIRLPVDQTKFSLFGFSNYAATVAGQSFPLVLNYRLSDGEIVYGASVGQNRTISKDYSAQTLNKVGMYTPKLYAYPVWVDNIRGYRLEWFMYDLDRNIASLVTPFVKINTNSQPFEPIGYGKKQTLSVSINLKDVFKSGKAYIHVQTIDIILRRPGIERITNWAIGFDPDQVILFGENNKAVTKFINTNLSTIDITCGETLLDSWLNRLYYMTKPLTDQEKESGPPIPDYFSVGTESWEVAYPIAQWKSILTINHVIPNSGTVFIKFFQRTPDTDIQLSIAGMPVYQSN
jgi:hypothetical protein